ncbi:MAG TPA: hypothetical protein VKZ75_07180 [Cyclobacteriaceae bacterium]|nr:hypothetical protein [Cyclobacteriaceae bacterium]
MRKYLIPLAAIFMAGCSSQKYAYHFDKFDYNIGKHNTSSEFVAVADEALPEAPLFTEDPLKLHSEALTASADNSKIVLPASTESQEAPVAEESPARSYKEMSRAERKEFRKEAKALIKTYIKAKKEGDEVKAAQAAQAMDHDLKMAAIFGAVGIVALIIGGDVFWIIGGIALIIGVVFFVLWLSRQ